MKTARMLTILAVAMGLMVCQAEVSEAAEMGTAFTYQGHLYDANVVANGEYDLQFKLYDSDDPCDCNQIGADVNAGDMEVIDGYFTVALDFNDANAFNGDARWLEICVRPGASSGGYTTLSPRQEVTPTPYALQIPGIFVDNAGYVGIGTTSPAAKLEVDGNIQTDGIYVPGTGDLWKAKESNRAWWSVAMSADGTIQTAVASLEQIYVSTDSGNTWTPKESDRWWRSVAMSADGTIQTAVVSYGQIYVSTDSGDTWTPKESDRWWRSVAMSADGTKQTAVVENGYIYVSTNSGNNWTAKESAKNWQSVAMSADGTIQTAVVYNGQIYVSTDSGNTWTAKESNREWYSVAMSADGTIQTAVARLAQIYVSTDWGNTWTAKESIREWRSVAMSADGTKQTAVGYWRIYVSTDSGNSWTAKGPDGGFWSVAMSADGTIQTAVVLDGQIYVSSAGSVGIGTTSPAALLEVNGNIKTTELDVNGTVKILAWHDQQVDPNGHAWVGSILFQWGTRYSTTTTSQWFDFPIEFPTECFTVNPTLPGVVDANTVGFYLDRQDWYANQNFTFLAVGH